MTKGTSIIIYYMDIQEQIAFKKKVIEACKSHLKKAVAQLRNAMDDAQTSADEGDQSKDQFDPYRNQMMNRREMFAQQLSRNVEQIDLLDRMDPQKISRKVEYGSIVITDKQKLFIAGGLGKVMVEDVEFFVMSPQVPFFAAIDGLKTGDAYSFRGQTGTIKEVF
jgi:hypothetical protein